MSGRPAFKHALDELYARYAHRRWVHPDPLEALYRYHDVRDREIAGLVAACLAYGNVRQILRSTGRVLDLLGPSPRERLMETPPGKLTKGLAGFKHRWTTVDDVAGLLGGVRGAVQRHGSLDAAFARHWCGDMTQALCGFVDDLRADAPATRLLPDPARGSACKRLHLYLRWMVRRDAVDPGGWEAIPPASLCVPLDVHMHRMARLLGFTSRRQADCRAAREATEGFRRFCPQDPVRYDFALTRLGIHRIETPEDLLSAAAHLDRP